MPPGKLSCNFQKFSVEWQHVTKPQLFISTCVADCSDVSCRFLTISAINARLISANKAMTLGV